MRILSRLVCLLTIGSVSLSACTGTEVGNGARPKNPDETETPTSERAGDLPDASTSGSTNAPTTTSGEVLAFSDVVSYLLAACGSPLAQAGVSSFKAMPDYTLEVVEQSSNWRINASQQTVSYTGVIKSAPSADSLYALAVVDPQSLPVATSYTCSTISEQTIPSSGGASTRRTLTVTTERGVAKVRWSWFQPISGDGSVTQIEIQAADSTVTFIREP